MTRNNTHSPDRSRNPRNALIVAAVLFATGLAALSAPPAKAASTFCTDTAMSLRRACGFDLQDNYWVAIANCTNESDAVDRKECRADAASTRDEENALCGEQLESRLGACAELGEGRYDPEFEPRLFDRNFAHPSHPNPYFPLRIGNRWEYSGGSESNTVEITNETKRIDDVTCLVSRDLVYEEGTLKEATDDWFAQGKDGSVWYCGEEVKNYEVFEGDQPQALELVSIDGRFKAGVESAKPGIIFLAQPRVGQSYLEEFSLANAEDMAEVFSVTYSYGEDSELDRQVPRRLAQLLCNHNCVVTENISLLEPGVVERKYYARGIGTFLETNLDTGEVTQLVSCNFDRRCASLPRP